MFGYGVLVVEGVQLFLVFRRLWAVFVEGFLVILL